MMKTMETMMESVSLKRAPVATVTFGVRVATVLAALRWAFILNRSRMDLSELTDEQLADIGISRYEAERECRKVGLF
ncbi:DUF1127 domain-containing protein [Rhizobium sp. C1]|uniref:DUF1127 domain-containing protein n=1 Tax=Rhizobium sp. C1 TaxID=1349799 RepID=UPI001E41C818|nr:DUF1127 domain-containing protein [Rhizobium sp. C1]MCD2176871.1 DUF1127 domain-containing protein [Rhizobium sp. C1]